MKHRNTIMAISAVLFLSFSSSFISHGEWVQEGEDWRYLSGNGTIVADKWVASAGAQYYLGSDGLMVHNTLLEIGNELYYFSKDGSMAQNQWHFLSDEDGGHWYYFQESGKAFRKKNSRFTKQIGEKTYGFDDEGRMLIGWLDSDGMIIDDSSNPFTEATYYCDDDGSLYQNRWLKYVNGGERELESDIVGYSYEEYQEIWFYFDKDGKKVKSNGIKPTERLIDGKTYAFDENGVMLFWWWGEASSSNATKFYNGHNGGHLLENTWVWMYPSEVLDKTDYRQEEASWWRIGSQGHVIRNRITTINGVKYAFDEIGRMQTGFVLFDGTKQFAAQYDVDQWESKDFIEGNLFTIEKADLYLFATDELNDGAMRFGKDIKIELADGVFTFGFSSTGKAYGNRNQLQKHSNKFYINGLRLDADTAMKYGVVKTIDDNENEFYHVVDTNGMLQKGNRVVGDNNGNWFVIVNGEFKVYLEDCEKPKWYAGPEGIGFYYYDKENKDDRYAGGLIAGGDTIPSISNLPDEGRLNFN